MFQKVIYSLFSQGNQISQGSRPSLYLMVGLWCLMAVVLTNAYTSTLTSYLTVPKLEPIVNTLEELAANGRIKITLDFESDLSKVFLVKTRNQLFQGLTFSNKESFYSELFLDRLKYLAIPFAMIQNF